MSVCYLTTNLVNIPFRKLKIVISVILCTKLGASGVLAFRNKEVNCLGEECSDDIDYIYNPISHCNHSCKADEANIAHGSLHELFVKT